MTLIPLERSDFARTELGEKIVANLNELAKARKIVFGNLPKDVAAAYNPRKDIITINESQFRQFNTVEESKYSIALTLGEEAFHRIEAREKNVIRQDQYGELQARLKVKIPLYKSFARTEPTLRVSRTQALEIQRFARGGEKELKRLITERLYKDYPWKIPERQD